MEQWVEIASKNGIAVLVVIAVGWFFYKKIWPLFEKRLIDADAREQEHQRLWKEQGESFTETLKQDREYNARRFEEQGKMFMETIRRQSVLYDETHKAYLGTQREIARELRTLNQKMKNGNGK